MTAAAPSSTQGGVLVRGQVVPVPGLTVWNPKNAPDWCKLNPRDYRPRRTTWVRQLVVHTTKGMWPQTIKPGKGPANREQTVAHYWQKDPAQSAAHLVVGSDGEVACLADLALICAFHAEMSNDWSIGIEIYQEADGSIYQAALDAALKLIAFLSELFEILLQVPSRRYPGSPIARMDVHGSSPGGPDMVGVFGHRDNTDNRGRGDPGDKVFEELRSSYGADALDYDRNEDKVLARRAQLYLNAHYDAGLSEDGVAGPKTYRAMKAHGFARLSQIPA